MGNNLRREDAEAIVQMLMLHSKDLNRFFEERKEKRSEDELIALRKIIGNLKGLIYSEVIEAIEKEHKGIMDEVYAPMSGMKFEFPKLQK